MTDDQIAAMLKPKGHDWKALIAVLIGAAGIAWGIAKWAATTPTRDEFNSQRDDIVRIRIELPAMNGKIERLEDATTRIEQSQARVESKLDEKRRR